eukprot:1142096-Pelagomonas_calceolata.AAC.1
MQRLRARMPLVIGTLAAVAAGIIFIEYSSPVIPGDVSEEQLRMNKDSTLEKALREKAQREEVRLYNMLQQPNWVGISIELGSSTFLRVKLFECGACNDTGSPGQQGGHERTTPGRTTEGLQTIEGADKDSACWELVG